MKTNSVTCVFTLPYSTIPFFICDHFVLRSEATPTLRELQVKTLKGLTTVISVEACSFNVSSNVTSPLYPTLSFLTDEPSYLTLMQVL